MNLLIKKSKRWQKLTKRGHGIGRWFLALIGILFLVGGITYFPTFASFLEDLGITNRAFISSLELPIEAFGAWLILLALFVRRRAKAIKVSVVLLLIVISTLFVWHTPSTKTWMLDTVNSWKERIAGTSQSAPGMPANIGKPVKVVDDWKFQLDNISWKGSTVTIKLTIVNLGPRRNFGYAGFDVGPELVAIDSTGKLVEPWVPLPDISKGELFRFPPYTKEFYPNESWTGSLKFEMSPYSGKTGLYVTRYYHTKRLFLFDLGEPRK